TDFKQQVHFFAGRDSRFEFHRLIVMQLRLKLAFETNVARKSVPDFDVDVLAGVVANPLAENLVIRPADERGFLFLERAVAANFAELIGAVDLQNQIATEDAKLYKLKDDFGIDSEVEL